MRDWLDVPPMFPIDEYRLFTKQVDKKSCLFMSEQERLKDKKKKMSNDQGRTQKELEKGMRVAYVGSWRGFSKFIIQLKFCVLKICIYQKFFVPLQPNLIDDRSTNG